MKGWRLSYTVKSKIAAISAFVVIRVTWLTNNVQDIDFPIVLVFVLISSTL